MANIWRMSLEYLRMDVEINKAITRQGEYLREFAIAYRDHLRETGALQKHQWGITGMCRSGYILQAVKPYNVNFPQAAFEPDMPALEIEPGITLVTNGRGAVELIVTRDLSDMQNWDIVNIDEWIAEDEYELQ